MTTTNDTGNGEIRLVADDHGLAVFGAAGDVQRFLDSHGLVPDRDASGALGIRRLGQLTSLGASTVQATSEISANSGRWMKLTKESAEAIEKYGLRESRKSGLATGVIKGEKGQVKGFVEFVRGPSTKLTNPAVLAGAAGIMAQLAMQQTMGEITSYLDRIDTKLDDVLRAHKDAVVSRLLGAGMAIDEAMTVSRARGRVDAVTWSKVQGLTTVLAEVQGYALSQLDALAGKIERPTKLSDLAEAAADAAGSTQEWLVVLARTLQLQEALDVLELDRVIDDSPEEIDAHRAGLQDARERRLASLAATTDRLLERVLAAAETANARVLAHPRRSPRAVRAGESVTRSLVDFQSLIGHASDAPQLQVRRWSSAAADVRDRALEAGADGIVTVRSGGGAALGRVRDGAAGARAKAQQVPDRVRAARPRKKPGQ